MTNFKAGDYVELYPDEPHLRHGRAQYGYITWFTALRMCQIDDGKEYGWMHVKDISLVHKPYTVEDWSID